MSRGLRVDKWLVAIVPARCTGDIINLGSSGLESVGLESRL